MPLICLNQPLTHRFRIFCCCHRRWHIFWQICYDTWINSSHFWEELISWCFCLHSAKDMSATIFPKTRNLFHTFYNWQMWNESFQDLKFKSFQSFDWCRASSSGKNKLGFKNELISFIHLIILLVNHCNVLPRLIMNGQKKSWILNTVLWLVLHTTSNIVTRTISAWTTLLVHTVNVLYKSGKEKNVAYNRKNTMVRPESWAEHILALIILLFTKYLALA